MIPLHDVVAQNRAIRPELDAAIARVLDSGILVGGKEIADFEQSFSAYLSVENTIGVGNATDGFEIAFKALRLQAEDEVIIPANAHVSPALAAMNVGLKPIFCDVDEDRMLLNAKTVKAAISSKTKAVVAVHLYGRVCPMDELNELCNESDIILIEDFSQAQGATLKGRKVGSFGKINVCSFYPTKPLGALGDGGAITTNNAALAERCRILAQYGWNPRDYATELGQNSRLDAIQAAVLSVKLKHLDAWNFDRIKRAQLLIQEQKDVTGIKVDNLQEGDICHLFTIRSKDRAGLMAKLNAQQIECGIHFPIPIHKQKLFDQNLSLPISEKACQTVFSLPLNQQVISLLS